MKQIKNIDIKIYHAIHHWLRKNFGKADRCENKNCNNKSKNFNWALKSNLDYEYKRENFIKLCRSCHAKIDCTEETRKKLSKSNSGKIQSKEQIEKRASKLRGIKRPDIAEIFRKVNSKPIIGIYPNGKRKKFSSLTEAAQKLKVTPGTIWFTLQGRYKNRKNIKFIYV